MARRSRLNGARRPPQGLRAASGTTNLPIYRSLVRAYPDRDRRRIETRGDKGKWFAVAKDSGFFDIAVGYAASHTVDTRHRYAFSVALQAATPDPRLVAKR